MDLARTERQAICDTLLASGPHAPTLCGDWTTGDLAAHLWVRENELPAMAAIMMSRERQAALRMAEAKARTTFSELVADLRRGPRILSPFRLPGVDERANALEFFVHHEDVRRAGPEPPPPRELAPEMDDELWMVVKRSSRLLFRNAPFGVDLETPDGRILPVRRRRHVTVVGEPGEILIFATGRTTAAHVRVLGEPADVARLTARLGI
ncbi:MAG: TIGR03085 family metal-binding protein [Actinomycetota bacterium]